MSAPFKKNTSLVQFVRAYIKSMRLYYSFVTGIAGWIGVSYYQYISDPKYFNPLSDFMPSVEIPTPDIKKIVILVFLFLGWGINQIINDYLGRKEDRINAPERPMVTGELHPQIAMAVSISLLFITLIVTWFFLEPIAIIPLLLGGDGRRLIKARVPKSHLETAALFVRAVDRLPDQS